MAQIEALSGRNPGSNPAETLAGSVPAPVAASPVQMLAQDAAADFILGASKGSVLALAGIDGEGLRRLLDQAEPLRGGPRALFTPIAPAATTEAIVAYAIDVFAETALRLWPIWFTDVSFAGCRNDPLGRLQAARIARGAAAEIAGLSAAWAEAAAQMALERRAPRMPGALPGVELAQLTLAISRSGLVLVADVGTACETGRNPAAVIQALEWIARHSHRAVVALFSKLPANAPPFDRILYGARCMAATVTAEPEATPTGHGGRWIAPWRGLPHPLSEIEQRLARALRADAELGPLFGFNQLIHTVRGSRPKVDLVWTDGRLVVELDGYDSHGSRTAFLYDRHRDYELALSGYLVLRIANDEVAQDVEKAIEKIRDVVRLCRARAASEA